MIEINGKSHIAYERAQECEEDKEVTLRELMHKYYRYVRWGIALGYVIIVTICGIMPIPRPVVNVGFPGVDKLLHAGAYAIMVIVIAGVCKRNHLLIAGGLSLLHGVLIEYAQAMLNWHQRELMDIVADMIGIAIGGIVWRVMNKLRG